MSEERNLTERLKRELTERGIVGAAKFDECVRESQKNRQSLIETLYRSSGASERDLVVVLSQIIGYPPVKISTFVIEEEILQLIPRDLAKSWGIIPVTLFENTLTVAMADPTDLRLVDDIRAHTGLRVKPALAVPSELEAAIGRYYGSGSKGGALRPAESFDEIMKEVRSQVQSKLYHNGAGETSDLLEEARSAPIIQLVNHILIDAIRRHASDVFVEPWERTMRIRYRIDGVLEEVLNAPRNFVGAVVSRIKVMSRLNIAERRVPQDGRIKVRILGREIDLRVSILPTSFGEKACIRLLDSSAEAQDLERLGFREGELEVIRRSANRPHGMILVTGPTGSGKTTTLYAVLRHLDSPEKNITTVEDPVEYQASGINQVNVREPVGLTFPAALRSILRQDPDVILIGEIRDTTTMDIAVKAALTGHLVLSTLHTNDATSAVVRMINMGVEPFLIASSVLMISAQRLVRKLCPNCKVAYSPEKGVLRSLRLTGDEKASFYRTKGCSHCRNSGFIGRTVITELFEMKPAILDMIVRENTGEELRELARKNGMKTIRESGLEKAMAGVTTIEEVLRVTSSESLLQTQEA